MISKRHCRLPLILLACGLSTPLGGCSTTTGNNIADNMPSSVGLPADAPQRPAEEATYPAVHDMPPPRADAVLTADDQEKLEKDLTAVRTRQEAVTGVSSATRAKTKKQTPAASADQASGSVPASNAVIRQQDR